MSAALLILAIAVQQPQDTVVLKPVVVTATRIPTPAAAVSAAVTVISGASLRERGIRTVAEALRDAPGATVVETGGPGSQTSLFLRGGESDYVKVLLDGVPLNQPGGSLDFADLTLDNVDRIEIVRGPASVLYGSDAVTGVIQIFTRGGIGVAAPRVAAAARAGTRRTSDLSADVTGGTGPLVYSASAGRFGADGLYAYNSEYRNTTAGARLRLAPDARTEASLAYHYGDNTYRFPTDGAGQPADSNQVSTERGPTVSLALARVFSGAVDVQALATLREQRLLFVNEEDSPGEDGRFESTDLVQRTSIGALANWRGGGTSSIVTVGVDYERERQRGRSVFEASFGSFPDSINVQRVNRAAYLQALLGLDRAVSLTLGVRAEDNSQFGGHATYRGGVVYRAGNETRVRVSAGTGFKEPTFFENFARGFVRGNPDLDPERSTSWEAGLDHTAGALTLVVTYFDQRFRDLIEFTFTPAPPDSVNYFNVAGARAAGVEASAEVSLGRGIVAALRYTYLRTRVREPGLDPGPDAAFAPGERLLRRPAHALAASVRTPVGRRALVAVDGRAVGARDDLDFARAPGSRRVTLDPYVRLNVAAEYRVARSLAFTARIENVLDDRSREIANFPVAGRSLFFGLRR